MTFTIRPFVAEDYTVIAAIATVCLEESVSAESLRWTDENRDARCKAARWVAEVGGQPVGYGQYSQAAGSYHPRKFEVTFCVDPDHQRQGIGGALYDRVLEGLRPFDPISLGAGMLETWPASIRFLERRGFREVMRTWENHLDLTSADMSQFDELLARVAALGYEVTSYAAIKEEPQRVRELFAFVNRMRQDVPSAEPVTDFLFDTWLSYFAHKHAWQEGYLLALKEGRIVGMSSLWKTDQADVVHNGLAGVDREHRGQGLSTSLKVHGIRLAQAAGYRTLKTWNASNNQAMLAVNSRLGYQRQPAWVNYRLELHP